ncbi:hypothetical protein [Allokutzneria sp. NRRL B-24872]|uniref:hypothetical protein n=1 Tax=Allokutzneria sp. NRRL B-24872 TaxID=1137961 RepID=UPI000A37DE0F|nr:hypothetical protein [Allokutzneria sp. NRRL B-24872]
MRTRFAAAAVAAAFAVAGFAGTAHADGDTTLGPFGYNDLKLGQSEQAAVETGLLVDGEGDQVCRRYYFTPSEGSSPRASGVWISGLRGVTLIGGTSRMRTAEGITEGASLQSLQQHYPQLVQDPGSDWIYFTPAPGNPSAKYRFVVYDGVVDSFVLELNDRAGC